jgi:soluble lytic murein transglycosylase-like protein
MNLHTRRTRILICALAAVSACMVGRAGADEARLRNGNTLEVTGYRIERGLVVLSIDGGGEIALPQEQVLEIRRTPRRSAPAEGGPRAVSPPDEPASAAAATLREIAAGDGLTPAVPAPAPLATPDRAALRDLAGRIAERHQVDRSLVQAVIEVESRYNAQARSPRGAIGLMQLMPETAARFEVRDPYDPDDNIEGGVRYLKELLERYSGQVRLALAAYNAGEEAVERHNGIPPFRETIQYVNRVLRELRR